MSEWQTVLVCSMTTLAGIFVYIVYLDLKLKKAEKK
ncbi:MAG: hypothetical protein BWY28_00367 [bacterium ADurb.Bin236]|nr:MAG: hypothetical protein BWY28_00367 [bacterium ADurb.Bin236]